MANWASTSYVIEGPEETLKKIYDAINNHPVEEGSSEDWEGNVLLALSIDFRSMKINGREPYMRGFIEEAELGEVLRIHASEAGGVTDFSDVLEAKIEGIKAFYVVEESGNEIYATNDREGKYFKERWYVDTCIMGIYQMEYFTEEKAMYKWLSSITNTKIESEDDVEKFNDTCAEKYTEENFISIHQYKIV